MALQGHADGNEIIWGAEAIGAAIGLSKRQTFHLLETEQLKGAKKIGRRWCITRRNLSANFETHLASGTAVRTLIDLLSPDEREALLREVTQ